MRGEIQLTSEQKRVRREERKASELRMALAHTEAQVALILRRCPRCAGKVHRNLALTGWVQCDGFGADGFRRDPNAQKCDWQGFTGE